MADRRSPGIFSLWLRISHPLLLSGTVLTYALGAGIADYLGVTIDWGVYLLGQAWVIALHLGGAYLYEYYNALIERVEGRQDPTSNGTGETGAGRPPVTLLVASAACLTAVASLSVLILRQLSPPPEAVLIMGLAFLGILTLSMPPVRLVSTGYGELLITILVANLAPALAFLLQAGELHRLLAMSTFPLTALFLASILVFQFGEYAVDVRENRFTMLVKLGWQRAMALHNGLILAAFLLMALALTFRLPLFIGLPAFLPLPLGLLQIWQMRRIADGARPSWLSLRMTAVVLFGTTTYLLAFAFWTR